MMVEWIDWNWVELEIIEFLTNQGELVMVRSAMFWTASSFFQLEFEMSAAHAGPA